MQKLSWTVAEAKAKLSEVIDRAGAAGPQTITRNGHQTAVWFHSRSGNGTGNLAEFFAASPLRGSELDVERLPEGPRDVAL